MFASHITANRVESLIGELATQLASNGGVTLSAISKVSVSGRTLTITTTDGNEHSTPLPDGVSREEFTTELEGVVGREEYERDRNGLATSIALKADAAWVRQALEKLPQQTGPQEPADSILSLSTEGNDLVLALTSGKTHRITLPQPDVSGEPVIVPMEALAQRVAALESSGTGGVAGSTISAVTLDSGNLVFRMSDGRDITTEFPTASAVITDNGDGTGTISS